MTRELMFLASVAFGSVALVAAYLYLFHAQISAKEVGTTAAAMMFGAYIGRVWGRKEAHG
ncbi:MAG: hypothetical protein B7Y44_02375 [Sphingomonadales bacterium 28-55-16]|nr:MAG: hypothetical protein B7Y44_02375 [Sphingomonadales bacterium 28-55-16]